MKERKNIFDTISFLFLAATIFILPVFFLPSTILGFAQAKISILSLGVISALCFFVIERIRQGSWSVYIKPVYLFFLLIPVTYLVSSYLSVNVHKSLIGGLFEQDTFHVLSVLTIFAFLVASLAKTPKRMGVLIISFISSVLLVILLQALRIVGGDMFSLGALTSTSTTLVGSWNDLTILGIILLGAILVALETIELKRWVVWAMLVLIFIPFLLVSLSTLAFDLYFITVSLPICMGVLALLIFAYVFSVKKGKISPKKEDDGEEKKVVKKNNLKSLPSLIVLILSLVLVLFGGPISKFLVSSTNVAYLDGRPTFSATYDVATKVIAQRPFFGSGPNSFAYEWNMNKTTGVNNFAFWNADFNFGAGIIPTSLITVGLVGFVLWILFYITVLSIAFRVLMSSVFAGFTPSLKMFVPFGVLFTTIMMFFYNPGIVVVTAHFLFMGLLLAIENKSSKEKEIILNKTQWSHFVSTFISLLFLVGIVLWGYTIVLKDIANYYANKAVTQSTTEDQMIGFIGEALRLDPSQSVYSQVAAQAYAAKVGKIVSLSPSEADSKKDELKNDLLTAINYSTFAERVDTTDYKSALATGRILEFFGSLGVPGANDQAISKYISASQMSPTNPLPFILASNVALSANKKDISKQYLIQGLTLKSDYSDVPTLAQGIADLIQRLNKASGSVAPVDTKNTNTPAATSTPAKPSKSSTKK